ncbi:class I SAM-dependent methyltransferase [Planktotalea sp.]|uniref:class I SAM-dependent methyltransferase n=1 Tax=Planktotalea sp. TaxID=2029877 RepID=UPI00329A6E37
MSIESDNIIGLYRRHAQTWARRRTPAQPWTAHKWMDVFLGIVPDTKRILDIGCGTGDPIARYFIDQGCSVTGIDASPEMLEIAQARFPRSTWINADMRSLDLEQKFDGILAWHSSFHLTPEDQRGLFPIFEKHAAPGAALMFTSGTGHGVAMGEFEGEPLYHASLAPDEFRALLDQHGFEVVDFVVEDPDCGGSTNWLAKYRAN